ncbi:MAG: leucyl aminopeptidase family protein [Glaciecola sp.]
MAYIPAKYSNSIYKDHDLIIVISNSLSSLVVPDLANALNIKAGIDPRVGKQASLVAIPNTSLRCLHVPLPDLLDDYQDVRAFFALGKQLGAHLDDLISIKPLVVLEIDDLQTTVASKYNHALANIYFGICQHQWQPLEAREALGESSIERVAQISLYGMSNDEVQFINATEQGKRIARDLCGTEPERMAPLGFAEYCEHAFQESVVECKVESNIDNIKRDYPLLFAVARASIEVPRHNPAVIHLSYKGDGPIEHVYYLAGKGITYDTGGADLKVNGHMAGMSRDKGGAAAVAGLMYALGVLRPKGIKVIAQIGAVRNSIGAEAYVPDEIITSHAGVRVRVGNTDAEGRMVLADLLSHLKDQALEDEPNKSKLYSVATLTGHALVALGPYTALVENAQAINKGEGEHIAKCGEQWGDPCERSLLRKEDFEFIKPRTKADDVLSSNNAPSVSTVRGHQFPAAFLSIASGIQRYDTRCETPLAYTHIDIAGSGVEQMDWQHGKPTAAPVVALLAAFTYQ